MIHLTTGNRCDVVYTYDNGQQVLVGIKPWDGALIPLEDPRALATGILQVLAEIAAQEERARAENIGHDLGTAKVSS